MSRDERKMLYQLQSLDVGYNISDKIFFGPAIYSKDLFKEQCLLHLEDSKGTYSKTSNANKNEILKGILRQLCVTLNPFKSKGLGWKYLIESLIRDATKTMQSGRNSS